MSLGGDGPGPCTGELADCSSMSSRAFRKRSQVEDRENVYAMIPATWGGDLVVVASPSSTPPLPLTLMSCSQTKLAESGGDLGPRRKCGKT